ncbi:PQQ-dependent sugar dehydrogenase [Streptosporangium sp. NPDC001682]
MKRTRMMVGRALAALLLPSVVLVAVPAPAHAHEAATHWSNYEKITLTKNVGEPIDMAVLPDRRVLHTARNGDIRLTDGDTGITKVINTIPVYANSEDGLQTIAIDPGFAQNKWVYVYYAPKTMTAPYPETTPTGSAPNSLPAGADESYWNQWKGYNQLSRFKWTGDALHRLAVLERAEELGGPPCLVGVVVGDDPAADLGAQFPGQAPQPPGVLRRDHVRALQRQPQPG